MRVLALTHRTPFPPDKGDKIRTHHLLTRVAREAEVHLVAFAEPPSDLAHAARLRRHFASVTLVPLDARVQRALAMPWVLTSRPLTLPVFDTPAMRRAVDDVARGVRPDVIFAESTSMAPHALRHPEAPLVMDFVDVDSAKWRAYAERSRPPMRQVYAREAATLERFEREVAERAAVSVITAPREKSLLDAIAPGCDVRVLENGVDTDYFAPAASPAREPSAVFFGAMDYHANVEAAVFLAREVMPRLRERFGRFRLVIAGSKPAPEVRALAADDVVVTGYVDDIRPWVQGCAVCAIPLRVARGVQNKVLEAMAMGVPVVCSPAAAEGIDAVPGDHLAVADYGYDGRHVAEAIASLVEHPDLADSLGAAGRARVVERYGWDPKARALSAVLAEAAARRS